MKMIRWSFLTLILPSSISWSPYLKFSSQRHSHLYTTKKPDLPKTKSSNLPTTSSQKKRKSSLNPKFKVSKDKPTVKSSSSPKLKVSQDQAAETWRIFEVPVHPDALFQSEEVVAADDPLEKIPVNKMYLHSAVMESLMMRLKCSKVVVSSSSTPDTPREEEEVTWKDYFLDVRVVRRSLDARRKRGFGTADIDGPRYVYVLDVDLPSSMVQKLKMRQVPGRIERLVQDTPSIPKSPKYQPMNHTQEQSTSHRPTVVIVGAGPAGLFCALTLAQTGKVHVIVLERGQAVESRGKSIGALMHRRFLDTESNFAFGEGGAGTWSDGKLTTRIGRNSESVRRVLETLVSYGAPAKILVDGAPHLGTDNLVRLLRNMRNELRLLGAEVRFGARMTDVSIDANTRCVQGVDVEYGKSMERGAGGVAIENKENEGTVERIKADRVVIATGHSARDVYELLHSCGVQLEPKGFAVGFRIEHPQKVINKIQYGEEWGASAYSGKVSTDVINQEYFSTLEHKGRLPVSSYRLATDKAFDGESFRGVFSFCQCPGGQIVISSTNANEICINGMSFSKRDSLWANAALVVTVDPDDPILDSYREKHGVLAGLAFQRDMEQRAAQMGGGNLVVPVQRVTDFINKIPSTTAPTSSYRLGVKPSPCHEIYPQKINEALKDAVINHFNRQMPGFLSDDALLHAVETRTSSPVRVSRDPQTKQALGVKGLFPSGEGAGFAGGIISASVDGLNVAYSVLDSLEITTAEGERVGFDRAIGFNY